MRTFKVFFLGFFMWCGNYSFAVSTEEPLIPSHAHGKNFGHYIEENRTTESTHAKDQLTLDKSGLEDKKGIVRKEIRKVKGFYDLISNDLGGGDNAESSIDNDPELKIYKERISELESFLSSINDDDTIESIKNKVYEIQAKYNPVDDEGL